MLNEYRTNHQLKHAHARLHIEYCGPVLRLFGREGFLPVGFQTHYFKQVQVHAHQSVEGKEVREATCRPQNDQCKD